MSEERKRCTLGDLGIISDTNIVIGALMAVHM